MFDGAFEGLTAAHVDPGGGLHVARQVGGGAQVYRYDRTLVTDDGAPIVARWELPWLTPNRSGRRWANQYVEVLTEQSQAVPLQVQRWADYDRRNPALLATTAPAPADFWDEAPWDTAQWDNGLVIVPLLRDHMVAKALRLAVTSPEGGPLTVFGLKLYGGVEQ